MNEALFWEVLRVRKFSSLVLVLILRSFLKWWISLHLSFDSWIEGGMLFSFFFYLNPLLLSFLYLLLFFH